MPSPALCGFLNIRKPTGMTSNDVVEEARRLLGENAGHTGTLDPLAEGVLVLGVGPARKFIPYMRTDKEYEAVLRLGQESDTLDTDGTLTDPVRVEATTDAIRRAGAALVGSHDLPVPAYSAVHSGGRRLYERARAGEKVTPPVRTMQIYSLDIVEISHGQDDLPRVRFTVACAGGTYIRSLTSEWGRKLGCGGVLERLVRTRSGGNTIDRSLSLDDVRALSRSGRSAEAIIPIGASLEHFPEVELDDGPAGQLSHGQFVDIPPGFAANPDQVVRIKVSSKTGPAAMIGLGAVFTDPRSGSLMLKPERMLPQDQSK